ncbi:unnamed protein product [Rhizophagus irregularis]|nr:unnamed protein product [Rhizophagus irregularis]
MARWGMSSIVVLLPEELSTRFNGCPMEMIGYWHDDASQEPVEFRQATLMISNQNILNNIGCANVSQNNPLEKNGFLIIFSDQKLYIGRVIAIYENIGGRHRYILRNITNIDAISYISVSLFIDVYNGLFFTNDCQIGGKLFAHIIPKEVIYYFGKPDTITFQNNSILTLNEEAL